MYPPLTAARTPDALAYLMVGSGDFLTFAQLDARSNELSHLLRTHSVQPGDSLVIFMPNNIAWPIAVAAGMRIGLYVTPLNWHLGSAELVAMLEQARPAAIITTTSLLDSVRPVLDGLGLAPLVLTVDGRAPGSAELWSSLDGYPTTPVPDELLGARVLFSGGTTGVPKAHRQPLPGIHPSEAPPRHAGLGAALGIEAGIRFLSPAPSYHAAPFTFQLMTMAAGGTVVCLETFDPLVAIDAIDTHVITHSQWVPTMLSRLLAARHEAHGVPSGHRVAVTSGAPCPPELKDGINEWWGDILHEYYGASEGYGHTYITPAQSHDRRGSVGRPLGEARVSILDHSGTPIPAGEVGRVTFRAVGADGAPVFRGMGDMGYLDDDGFLFLTGRESFMIVSGGVNIYPEEVEQVLITHPAVADVAVFGTPHPDFGEQVTAVVELAPAQVPDDELRETLIEHCRTRLARFKAPRVVEFVSRLPRLPTGKLNKRALQRAHVERSEGRSGRS